VRGGGAAAIFFLIILAAAPVAFYITTTGSVDGGGAAAIFFLIILAAAPVAFYITTTGSGAWRRAGGEIISYYTRRRPRRILHNYDWFCRRCVVKMKLKARCPGCASLIRRVWIVFDWRDVGTGEVRQFDEDVYMVEETGGRRRRDAGRFVGVCCPACGADVSAALAAAGVKSVMCGIWKYSLEECSGVGEW